MPIDAAAEDLCTLVEGATPEAIDGEAIVRMIKKRTSWKDANFQVMPRTPHARRPDPAAASSHTTPAFRPLQVQCKLFQAIQAAVQRSPKFPRAGASVAIPRTSSLPLPPPPRALL